MSALLAELLSPKKQSYKRYMMLISGMPKSGKTTLAATTSLQCPPPAQWNPAKPVALKDIMWLQFEPNATMYLNERGVEIPNILDWSDESLTYAQLKPAIDALPAAAKQYRDAGITTIVVDTLSTFNRLLLRDIIDRPTQGDMERIRAYGDVDKQHYNLFDNLRATGLNIVALVHLQHFAPFGEEGGNSAAAAEFKKTAAKQVDKVTAGMVGGQRTDFVPDLRPKPAGHWTRMVDAALVAAPEKKIVSAGKFKMEYKFLSTGNSDFSAGSRWAIGDVCDGYLRPVIEAKYPSK